MSVLAQSVSHHNNSSIVMSSTDCGAPYSFIIRRASAFTVSIGSRTNGSKGFVRTLHGVVIDHVHCFDIVQSDLGERREQHDLAQFVALRLPLLAVRMSRTFGRRITSSLRTTPSNATGYFSVIFTVSFSTSEMTKGRSTDRPSGYRKVTLPACHRPPHFLHAERLAHIGELVDTVDDADHVEHVDLTDHRAVDLRLVVRQLGRYFSSDVEPGFQLPGSYSDSMPRMMSATDFTLPRVSRMRRETSR
jgi:hypothetical protein